MPDFRRNDPCPCGSGKKFKKCHMGREEDLVLDKMEHIPEGLAKKIAALSEVEYGRTKDIYQRLDIEKLTGSPTKVKFVDLGEYLKLGIAGREERADLNRVSAGQMVNPIKTVEADPDHIYIAISPAVSDSTLIHQLAHALDYIGGSKLNPALAKPLSLELQAPLELLEHPAEFGQWLSLLANETAAALDAEDAIVEYLHSNGKLIPGEFIDPDKSEELKPHIDAALEFIRTHRQEIDDRIKNKVGYLKKEAPKSESN